MILWYLPAKVLSVISIVLDKKTEKLERELKRILSSKEEKRKAASSEPSKEQIKNPIWCTLYHHTQESLWESFCDELVVLDSYISDDQKIVFHNSMPNFLDFTLYIEREVADDILRLLIVMLTATNCNHGMNTKFPQSIIPFVMSETHDQLEFIIKEASRSEIHRAFALYEIKRIGQAIGALQFDLSENKRRDIWESKSS